MPMKAHSQIKNPMSAVSAVSAVSVEIAIDEQAHRNLVDTEFLQAWQALHDSCPHATAFQAPHFVRTWYSAYRAKWRPVVVRGFDAQRNLVGLWLLAYESTTDVLTHAGAHQAEYHAWLARAECAVAFLAAAWREIQQRLRFATLRFKYLPSTLLTDCLRNTPGMRGQLGARIINRPLALLRAAEIKASFAKKSNKSRFNRLKRLGTLEFERIAAPDQLDRVLDDLIACYDFQQGATHAVSPFREDPVKREFHRALLSTGDAGSHLTVTKLDGRAIAGVWGAVSGKVLHVGILFHSPLLAEYSPGKLHLMLLSEFLLEEGFVTLDLTPGGDEWKDRFANVHDQVVEVVLHRTRWERVRDDLLAQSLAWTKRRLGAVGVSPSALKSALKSLQRANAASLWRKFVAWFEKRREYRVYFADRTTATSRSHDARVQRNSLTDLFNFEPVETWQTREAFLSDALSRLKSGEFVYTLRVGDRLACVGWMVRLQSKSFLTEVQQSITFGPGTSTLYDFYTHPDFRGRGFYRALLGHMIFDAFIDDRVNRVCIGVLADNVSSRRAIEASGFGYQGSLYWRQRFGAQTKHADPVFSATEDVDA